MDIFDVFNFAILVGVVYFVFRALRWHHFRNRDPEELKSIRDDYEKTKGPTWLVWLLAFLGL
ncbi:hypothetical protein [Aliiroseovarius marinus]|uniref:hypothetical protein n=1 Tax=Aliiroseovarius marinus TaxID=2500159 RepID=UPI003D7E16D9